jgi:hypothetical protein
MRRGALCLLLLVALTVQAAPVAASDSVTQTVETYLGSIDTPIPEARWKALGPEAGPVLFSIASNDVLPSRRAKALHALAIVDAARAGPLARAMAASPEQPLVVRSAAVWAVARSLPAAEAVAVLRPLLGAPSSIPLQRRAADSLAQVGATGCAALSAHAAPLGSEARAPFAQALARCTAAK